MGRGADRRRAGSASRGDRAVSSSERARLFRPSPSQPRDRMGTNQAGLVQAPRWEDTWPRLRTCSLTCSPARLAPTAGIVVPEGGVAAGFSLNVEWNANAPIYQRFDSSVEGRGSENGFWEVGAKVQTLLAATRNGASPPGHGLRHPPGPAAAPSLWPGQRNAPGRPKALRLRDSAVAASVDVPIPSASPGVSSRDSVFARRVNLVR